MTGNTWIVNIDKDLDFLKLEEFFKNLSPYMVLFLTNENKFIPELKGIKYKLINIKKSEISIFDKQIYCLETEKEYVL